MEALLWAVLAFWLSVRRGWQKCPTGRRGLGTPGRELLSSKTMCHRKYLTPVPISLISLWERGKLEHLLRQPLATFVWSLHTASRTGHEPLLLPCNGWSSQPPNLTWYQLSQENLPQCALCVVLWKTLWIFLSTIDRISHGSYTCTTQQWNERVTQTPSRLEWYWCTWAPHLLCGTMKHPPHLPTDILRHMILAWLLANFMMS